MEQSELSKANADILAKQGKRSDEEYKRTIKVKNDHIAWLNCRLIEVGLELDARNSELEELRYRIASLEK